MSSETRKEKRNSKNSIFLLVFLVGLILLTSLLGVYRTSKKAKVAVIYDPVLSMSMLKTINGFVSKTGMSLEVIRIPYCKKNLEQDLKMLSSNKVRIIIGPALSTHAGGILPFLEKYDLYAISPYVTSPTVIGKSKRFVTVAINDNEQIDALSKRMLEDGMSKIVIFKDTHNNLYTDYFSEKLTMAFSGKVLEVIQVEDPFEVDLATSKLERADGILMITSPKQTAILHRRLKKLGLPLKYYASDYATGPELYEYGDKFDDLLISTYLSAGSNDIFGDFTCSSTIDALYLAKMILEESESIEQSFSDIFGSEFELFTGKVKITHNGCAQRVVSLYTPTSGGKE